MQWQKELHKANQNLCLQKQNKTKTQNQKTNFCQSAARERNQSLKWDIKWKEKEDITDSRRERLEMPKTTLRCQGSGSTSGLWAPDHNAGSTPGRRANLPVVSRWPTNQSNEHHRAGWRWWQARDRRLESPVSGGKHCRSSSPFLMPSVLSANTDDTYHLSQFLTSSFKNIQEC